MFNFREDSRGTGGVLWQLSSNPSVYTKLRCYLPWIAGQYGLEYEDSDDPACSQGTGDLEDVTQVDNKDCLANPIQFLLFRQARQSFPTVASTERPCIFPFYIDDQLFESCVAYGVNGLNSPVFICPTFNIITKRDGINAYTSDQYVQLTAGMCPVDPFNVDSDLDPDDQTCSDSVRRIVFSQCKNNCPGGKATVQH